MSLTMLITTKKGVLQAMNYTEQLVFTQIVNSNKGVLIFNSGLANSIKASELIRNEGRLTFVGK